MPVLLLHLALLVVVVGSPLASPAHATATPASDLASLAVHAVEADAPGADLACRELRAAGPDGLSALIARYEGVLAAGPADPSWPRLKRAIERVAGQYDAHASRLYWYDDFDAARRAARHSGKPILSLRMLGRLDEDLSCTNSRFFRVALYANTLVSRRLREQFVLHWASERTVPRVTVDYGDGRRLVRTLTGNSFHVVLDAQGRPVDALPGLWGPQAFLDFLGRSSRLERELRALDDSRRTARLRDHHASHGSQLEDECRRAGLRPVPEGRWTESAEAWRAARRAVSKSVVEAPLVAAVLGDVDPPRLGNGVVTVVGQFEQDHPGAFQAAWDRELAFVSLDDASHALMSLKGNGWASNAFRQTIAMDQVVNRFRLLPRLHGWFATASPSTLDALHRFAYDELFATPQRDEWLGLTSTGYVAIDDEGIERPAR